ncbi:MAG: response regulator [Candidatus Promineifilaceae bacterium]|nr:response regulator [Candidatus Promineifilaceae bacterium]
MRILIADDEPIIRMGLKSMLQELNHKVYAAVDGREALQLAKQHRPELAILDIKMPKLNGLQVADTLARTQPMPILLLTAFSQAELVDIATELPIQGYLVKPIQPQELSAAIAVASKRFADQQALESEKIKLEERLAARKLIDRAKGKLMGQGYSEEDAYRILQKQARDNNQTMKQVAEAVLNL